MIDEQYRMSDGEAIWTHGGGMRGRNDGREKNLNSKKLYVNDDRCFGRCNGSSLSLSSCTVLGTFFRRIVRDIELISVRRRLCCGGGWFTPERLLCSRRSATPFSSIEKSKPVLVERRPVDMSVRLPACGPWMRDFRRTPRLVLTARRRYEMPPCCLSRLKSWSVSSLWR